MDGRSGSHGLPWMYVHVKNSYSESTRSLDSFAADASCSTMEFQHGIPNMMFISNKNISSSHVCWMNLTFQIDSEDIKMSQSHWMHSLLAPRNHHDRTKELRTLKHCSHRHPWHSSIWGDWSIHDPGAQKLPSRIVIFAGFWWILTDMIFSYVQKSPQNHQAFKRVSWRHVRFM